MAWNADKPALGNQIAEDIPDIEENFQYLYDYVSLWAIAEYSAFQRSTFTYNGGATAYTVKAKAASYYCKTKYCYWVTEVTTAAIGTPGSTTWYYLYLDYSAITSGTAITATELIWSDTAPTWNDTYRGWYNGDDRCIFAALTNAAPDNIKPFYHDGGDFISHEGAILEATSVTPSTTFTDVDCATSIPAFAKKAIATFYCQYSNTTTQARWRTNGSTGGAHYVGSLAVDVAQRNLSSCPIMTDSSQVIEIAWDDATTNLITVWIDGWYFPIGM